MKLKTKNILTAVVLGFVMAFTSCSKDDGAIPDRIDIQDVPAVTTNLTTGGGTAADLVLADAATFAGAFTMKLYFAGAVPPTKVDVVVRKNGDLAGTKLFKADITALPANFTVSAAEIEALFGAPLAVKDTYDFAPDIYVADYKYQAFPLVGNGNGQGITGMSAIGFGVFVRYTVK